MTKLFVKDSFNYMYKFVNKCKLLFINVNSILSVGFINHVHNE